MFEILIISACFLLNAILSGTEIAFVTVGKPRLREMARKGHKEASRILKLRENPERTLSVLQVGITLVGAIAAAVSGAGAEDVLSPILKDRFYLSESVAEFISILVVVIPLTYLNVVVGELVPKSLALRNSLSMVLKSARWLVFFDRLLAPVVTILEWSTKIFLKIGFWRTKPDMNSTTTDTVELDLLSQQTRQYVLNLVGVEQKRIKDVLLPWEQVTTVKTNSSPEEVENTILSSGHTRLPVLENDKVIGILNTKEFIAIRKTGETNWSTIVRPPVKVHEHDSLLRAFRHMQERRSHLSIVYDGINRIGIVTMEDILEEVMGEIYDEDDDEVIRRILRSSGIRRNLAKKL